MIKELSLALCLFGCDPVGDAKAEVAKAKGEQSLLMGQIGAL